MGFIGQRKRVGACYSGLIACDVIDTEEIYTIAKESVCPVVFEVDGQKIASGSSFIYKQCIGSGGSKLYFLTNLHVIQAVHSVVGILNTHGESLNYEIYVRFKGKKYPLDLAFVPPWDIYRGFLGKYESNFRFDFSVFVIETEKFDPVNFFSIKEPLKINASAKIYALGYPQGLELSISDGIVSHVYDDSNTLSEENKIYTNTIQHNILINPGNSGGPTVNQYGQVVGISTFGLTRDGAVGLNFSVDIRFVLELLQRKFLRKFSLKEYIENSVRS